MLWNSANHATSSPCSTVDDQNAAVLILWSRRSDGGAWRCPTPSATAAAPVPTMTVAPSKTPGQESSYIGNGAFAVGTEPRGGLTAAIPPGRFRVEPKAGEHSGAAWRCSDLLCGPGKTDDTTATTIASEGGSLMEILPETRRRT
jgi:hypothetical protein